MNNGSTVADDLINSQIRLDGDYYSGGTNQTTSLIKHTSINTSGDYKLGFEVGGSERMSVDNTGQVNMSNLPTSNPGGSGNLWNNSGVLNIT